VRRATREQSLLNSYPVAHSHECTAPKFTSVDLKKRCDNKVVELKFSRIEKTKLEAPRKYWNQSEFQPLTNKTNTAYRILPSNTTSRKYYSQSDRIKTQADSKYYILFARNIARWKNVLHEDKELKNIALAHLGRTYCTCPETVTDRPDDQHSRIRYFTQCPRLHGFERFKNLALQKQMTW